MNFLCTKPRYTNTNTHTYCTVILCGQSTSTLTGLFRSQENTITQMKTATQVPPFSQCTGKIFPLTEKAHDQYGHNRIKIQLSTALLFCKLWKPLCENCTTGGINEDFSHSKLTILYTLTKFNLASSKNIRN